MPYSVDQFADIIKQKLPQYKDVENQKLVDSYITKYPQYKDQVQYTATPSTPEPFGGADYAGKGVVDVITHPGQAIMDVGKSLIKETAKAGIGLYQTAGDIANEGYKKLGINTGWENKQTGTSILPQRADTVEAAKSVEEAPALQSKVLNQTVSDIGGNVLLWELTGAAGLAQKATAALTKGLKGFDIATKVIEDGKIIEESSKILPKLKWLAETGVGSAIFGAGQSAITPTEDVEDKTKNAFNNMMFGIGLSAGLETAGAAARFVGDKVLQPLGIGLKQGLIQEPGKKGQVAIKRYQKNAQYVQGEEGFATKDESYTFFRDYMDKMGFSASGFMNEQKKIIDKIAPLQQEKQRILQSLDNKANVNISDLQKRFDAFVVQNSRYYSDTKAAKEAFSKCWKDLIEEKLPTVSKDGLLSPSKSEELLNMFRDTYRSSAGENFDRPFNDARGLIADYLTVAQNSIKVPGSESIAALNRELSMYYSAKSGVDTRINAGLSSLAGHLTNSFFMGEVGGTTSAITNASIRIPAIRNFLASSFYKAGKFLSEAGKLQSENSLGTIINKLNTFTEKNPDLQVVMNNAVKETGGISNAAAKFNEIADRLKNGKWSDYAKDLQKRSYEITNKDSISAGKKFVEDLKTMPTPQLKEGTFTPMGGTAPISDFEIPAPRVTNEGKIIPGKKKLPLKK